MVGKPNRMALACPFRKVDKDSTTMKAIVAFDSQRLNTLQACPERYRLKFHERLELPELGEGIRKGSMMHTLLKHYYLHKMSGAGSSEASVYVLDNYRNFLSEITYPIDDIQGEVIRVFAEYCHFYKDERWIPVSVEEPFSTPIYEDDELILIYEGIIDLRVEVPGMRERPTVDHKTSSLRQYLDNLDNQFIGYAFVSGESTGFVNTIIFKQGMDKFARPPLPFDDTIKKVWLNAVVDSAREFLACETSGVWPRRIRSCNADKFPCIYRDLCKGDEKTQRWLKETRFRIVEPWDVFTRA
jgi:PD-(D/E)XK nuclease superfamily